MEERGEGQRKEKTMSDYNSLDPGATEELDSGTGQGLGRGWHTRAGPVPAPRAPQCSRACPGPSSLFASYSAFKNSRPWVGDGETESLNINLVPVGLEPDTSLIISGLPRQSLVFAIQS